MRYLAVITLIIMALALAACGSNAAEEPLPPLEMPPREDASAQSEPVENGPGENGPAAELQEPAPEAPAGGGTDGAIAAETKDEKAGMAKAEPESMMEPSMMEPSMVEPSTVDLWAMPGEAGTPTMAPQDVEAADAGIPRSGPAPLESPGHTGTAPDRDWRPRHEPELKAGEVDDNARWQDYLKFVGNYDGEAVHRTDLRDRQIIRVVDQDGNPVPNADVVISAGRDGKGPLWTNTTYADGRTMFFPAEATDPGMVLRDGPEPPDKFSLTVRRDGFTHDVTISVQEDGSTEIELGGRMDYGANVPLDVMFLLDSTGSMADEIRQIKSTLSSIAMRVSSLQSKPDLRFGMVSYRDRDDEYVTRLYDFDGNVERFQSAIKGVRADGGDDYPESLNQALHEAVNDASWRSDSIRLVFLIADAPPHLDYAQDEDYAVDMVRARERGIKIFSVASSGLDEQGEYVFRQIAQQTMGRFLFILYRTGGPQGGLDTPHDVEQFSVDQLDDLIVRLIKEELSALGAGEQSGMSLR